MKTYSYQGRRIADYPSLAGYVPHLLLYPLQLAPAFCIALLSLMLWIGLQSIASIVMLAIAVPWFLAYLELVIERTIQGEADAPRFGGEQAFLASASTVQGLLLPLLVGGFWYSLQQEHRIVAEITLIAGGFFFPAFLLCSSQFGMIAALNPLQWLRVSWLLGRHYIFVCLSFAGALLLMQWVSSFALFALIATCLYLLTLLCHLMGYLAFYRADALGLVVRIAASSDDDAAERLREDVLAETQLELALALRKHDHELALQILRKAGQSPVIGDDLASQEALFSALVMRPQIRLILFQATQFMRLLLSRGGQKRALETYRQCLDKDPEFLPLDMPGFMTLVRYVAAQGEDAVLGKLGPAAVSQAAASPVAIDIAFLYANHLLDKRRDVKGARSVLQDLAKSSSGHSLAVPIRQMLKALS